MSMEAAGLGLPETAGFSFERGIKSLARDMHQASRDFVTGSKVVRSLALKGSKAVLSFSHRYIVLPVADTVMPLATAMDPDEDYRYPTPSRAEMKRMNTELGRGFLKHVLTPATAVAFMFVLFPANGFSSKTSSTDEVPRISFTAQNITPEPVAAPEVPSYVRIDSDEWRDSRARLIRAYEQKREREHPAFSAPLPSERRFDSITVPIGVFSEDE